MTVKQQHEKIVRFVFLAFLIAIVTVLQLFASSVTVFETSFSLVLIPIALGAIVLGPMAGGILGLVFGFIVLMAGITGTDFFTATLFQNAPFITSLLCLGKGTLAGIATGLMYKLVRKKSEFAAIVAAAATTPIVNTGLFAVGSLFLKKTLEANFQPDGVSFLYFLFIIIIGINFLVEFAVNLIFSPALVRVVTVIRKQFTK